MVFCVWTLWLSWLSCSQLDLMKSFSFFGEVFTSKAITMLQFDRHFYTYFFSRFEQLMILDRTPLSRQGSNFRAKTVSHHVQKSSGSVAAFFKQRWDAPRFTRSSGTLTKS